MKRITSLLLIACTCLYAEQKGTFSVGVEGLDMYYKEYNDAGVLLDSEESSVTDVSGFFINTSYRVLDGIVGSGTKLQLDYSYVEGNTKYVGQALSGGTGYGSLVSSTANNIHNIELLISEHFKSGDWGPYVLAGVGYRRWERTLNTVQNEIYRWPYYKAGVGVGYEKEKFSISLEAGYQKAISPKMDYIGTANSSVNFNQDYTFDLGATDGYYVNIPTSYKIDDKLALTLSAMYYTWDITRSNNIYESRNNTTYYEPRSEAKYYKLRAGFTFFY